ncbi:MAG TPA: hypothetical protein VGD13_04515 [Xanthobacteraceae bacterium]|jgi:hypothetical protein
MFLGGDKKRFHEAIAQFSVTLKAAAGNSKTGFGFREAGPFNSASEPAGPIPSAPRSEEPTSAACWLNQQAFPGSNGLALRFFSFVVQRAAVMVVQKFGHLFAQALILFPGVALHYGSLEHRFLNISRQVAPQPDDCPAQRIRDSGFVILCVHRPHRSLICKRIKVSP